MLCGGTTTLVPPYMASISDDAMLCAKSKVYMTVAGNQAKHNARWLISKRVTEITRVTGVTGSNAFITITA